MSLTPVPSEKQSISLAKLAQITNNSKIGVGALKNQNEIIFINKNPPMKSFAAEMSKNKHKLHSEFIDDSPLARNQHRSSTSFEVNNNEYNPVL